jgi:hypothetical protein
MSENIKNDTMSTETQRKYPRKSFRKPVAVLYKGTSNIVSGFEIGEGGLSFQAAEQIDLDQNIIVNFFIPGGNFFSLNAVTRSAAEGDNRIHTYGISFDNVSLALKREIRAYVSMAGDVPK